MLIASAFNIALFLHPAVAEFRFDLGQDHDCVFHEGISLKTRVRTIHHIKAV
jgi:hypothetical protein